MNPKCSNLISETKTLSILLFVLGDWWFFGAPTSVISTKDNANQIVGMADNALDLDVKNQILQINCLHLIIEDFPLKIVSRAFSLRMQWWNCLTYWLYLLLVFTNHEIVFPGTNMISHLSEWKTAILSLVVCWKMLRKFLTKSKYFFRYTMLLLLVRLLPFSRRWFSHWRQFSKQKKLQGI